MSAACARDALLPAVRANASLTHLRADDINTASLVEAMGLVMARARAVATAAAAAAAAP
jgi:hypothetical protein